MSSKLVSDGVFLIDLMPRNCQLTVVETIVIMLAYVCINSLSFVLKKRSGELK
jgi:hypothetical protein